jgi:hypothetical protein
MEHNANIEPVVNSNIHCTVCKSNNVFKFTDSNSIVTRNTFPIKSEIKNIFNEYHFDSLLQYIKSLMINANSENNNFVKILNTQVQHYTPCIISDVKLFLQNKRYIILDIEDTNFNSIGWKLSWA